MNASERLQAAVLALADALRAAQPRSMLIGGVAAIAHGVARITRDVDATVVGEATDLVRLVESLAPRGIVPRVSDAVAFARQSQVLLLTHAPSGIDIDISLGQLPFEIEAIDAAVELPLAGGLVRLARPEDLVVYKFTAWRPQDRQDIERLLAIHADEMDLARVRRLAAEIAFALDEPERVRELEALMPPRHRRRA